MKLPNRKKNSKIDKLPPGLKETVDQMLLGNFTYAEIVDYLAENGIGLSQASVSRYAQGLAKNAMVVQVVGENFRVMSEQLAKYPKQDPAEVILSLTSHIIFQALSEVEPEDLKDIDLDKLLRESSSLVRAQAYKSRIDVQNQSTQEAGLESMKAAIFEAMAKEEPELYDKVSAFLNRKRAAIEEE